MSPAMRTYKRNALSYKRVDYLKVKLDHRYAAVCSASHSALHILISHCHSPHLCRPGAKVVIGDLEEAKAKEAAASLSAAAIGAGYNVTSSSDIERLLSTATTAFGSLDIMVNNAGIARDATMRKMTEEQFDDVIEVHLRGC